MISVCSKHLPFVWILATSYWYKRNSYHPPPFPPHTLPWHYLSFVRHSCNLHGSRVALSCLEIDVIVGGKNLFKSNGLMTPCFHVRDNKNHLCCCCYRPNWQKLFANSSGSSLLVSEIHWWIFCNKKQKPQTKILDCIFYIFWIFLLKYIQLFCLFLYEIGILKKVLDSGNPENFKTSLHA